MGRGSETRLQVGKNLNEITQREKGFNACQITIAEKRYPLILGNLGWPILEAEQVIFRALFMKSDDWHVTIDFTVDVDNGLRYYFIKLTCVYFFHLASFIFVDPSTFQVGLSSYRCLAMQAYY